MNWTITTEQMAKFNAMREAVFRAIAECLSVDGHCKGYEGTFRIQLPNYFADRDQDPVWQISLDSYLLCDGRGEAWFGDTFDQCLENAYQGIVHLLAQHKLWYEGYLKNPGMY